MCHHGRFLREDPLSFAAGDTNLYRYVFNSPTSAKDPTGLEWVWPWDSRANWRDWRIGEALTDLWNSISGTVGGSLGGAGVGALAGGAGGATAVVVLSVIFVTPIGPAGVATIVVAATFGAVTGGVLGAYHNSGKKGFGDGFTSAVTDSRIWTASYIVGCMAGVRMFRISPTGEPYVDWQGFPWPPNIWPRNWPPL